jgi:hypothetical protein
LGASWCHPPRPTTARCGRGFTQIVSNRAGAWLTLPFVSAARASIRRHIWRRSPCLWCSRKPPSAQHGSSGGIQMVRSIDSSIRAGFFRA